MEVTLDVKTPIVLVLLLIAVIAFGIAIWVPGKPTNVGLACLAGAQLVDKLPLS